MVHGSLLIPISSDSPKDCSFFSLALFLSLLISISSDADLPMEWSYSLHLLQTWNHLNHLLCAFCLSMSHRGDTWRSDNFCWTLSANWTLLFFGNLRIGSFYFNKNIPFLGNSGLQTHFPRQIQSHRSHPMLKRSSTNSFALIILTFRIHFISFHNKSSHCNKKLFVTQQGTGRPPSSRFRPASVAAMEGDLKPWKMTN